MSKGGQWHKAKRYQFWCLKILTPWLSLRKGACYVQAEGLGWAQPLACIKEFHPSALGTTPMIPRIIGFCRGKAANI